ncbi:MAG: arylsulfotransferase (ASST) [Erysipelotrichia bacterium]|nr:arylsulfotransferase (ASST) [Erysipelotrichia bacterium]NCC54657.1 arylsulfotransferase (ASST) [Erysipelotrichia bacterium]
MKKRLTFLLLLCISAALIICLNFQTIVNAITHQNAYWYEWNTSLYVDTALGENVYRVQKEESMSIFTNGYQNAIEKKIAQLVNKSQNSVLIYNPYGTNTASFYYTFKSDVAYQIKYTIHVDDDNISDYIQIAKTNQIDTNTYAYQFIGFVYGESNKLTIEYLQEEQCIKKQTYTIQMPNSASESNEVLEVSNSSSTPLSNGLYAVFGLDKNFQSNIYLYDNEGVLRSEYVLKNYRSDRLLFIDDTMLYAYKKNGFIQVNSLGKIINIYNFDGYEQHHDFIYDEQNHRLLILVNEKGSDTIEDVIIALDLTTKKVSKLVDMKTLLPKLYQAATLPEEGNTYGGDELDWIHLNSLTLKDDSLIVSSRELSTIIKIDNIDHQPSIDYMISDESLYTDSVYADLLLNKEGSFISQSGQHSITYEKDDTLSDSQYYLIMFNNNFTSSRTRPDLDYSAFVGAGSYTDGTQSYYYKYLVDEKAGTYRLVESVSLPYSSIVSNVQNYENHIITSSGKSHCFNEYDEQGNLIAQFNYNAEKYAYRIFKYRFDGIYFSSKV